METETLTDRLEPQSPQRKNRAKVLIIFTTILLVSMVIGSAVYLYLKQNSQEDTHTVSNPEKENDNNVTLYNNKEDDDESLDCIETYTNQSFPKLSFQYDKCKWKLTESIDPNSEKNYLLLEYSETPNIMKIVLSTCPMGGGYPECSEGEYSIINDKYVWIHNREQENYFLGMLYAEKETTDFTNYEDMLPTELTQDATICYRNTDLSLATESELYRNSCSQLYFYLSIPDEKTKEEAIQNTDTIIKSLSVK